MNTTLTWSEVEPGEWRATAGATTYIIMHGIGDLPWNVFLTNVEMGPCGCDEPDCDEIWVYRGRGRTLKEAKELAGIVYGSAPGDDGPRMEFLRRIRRERLEA